MSFDSVLQTAGAPMAETHREKVRRLYRERKAVAEAKAAKLAKRIIRRIGGGTHG